jgi:hypothetical protein
MRTERKDLRSSNQSFVRETKYIVWKTLAVAPILYCSAQVDKEVV